MTGTPNHQIDDLFQQNGLEHITETAKHHRGILSVQNGAMEKKSDSVPYIERNIGMSPGNSEV